MPPLPLDPIEVGATWVTRGTNRHARGLPVLIVALTPWSVAFIPQDPHSRKHRITVRREAFLATHEPRPKGQPKRRGRRRYPGA